MKLIIAGSRSISPAEFSRGIQESQLAKQATVVISGCAKGADQLGESWAAANNLPIQKFPADWNKHGKAAGPIRNREMAKNADGALVLFDGISPGSSNMIEEALKRNLLVEIWNFKTLKMESYVLDLSYK